jgi:hypothetical protein
MQFFKHKKIVALLAAAVVAIAAVGAYAYWTTTGTGSGSATTGTSTQWQVTSDAATVANTLTPGGPAETITWHAKNNSSGVQALANIQAQVATSVGVDPNATPGVWTASIDAGKPDCTKDDFALSADGVTYALAGVAVNDTESAGDVAAGGTASGTITIKMINKPAPSAANNQDNCKSVSVPLFFDAS